MLAPLHRIAPVSCAGLVVVAGEHRAEAETLLAGVRPGTDVSIVAGPRHRRIDAALGGVARIHGALVVVIAGLRQTSANPPHALVLQGAIVVVVALGAVGTDHLDTEPSLRLAYELLAWIVRRRTSYRRTALRNACAAGARQQAVAEVTVIVLHTVAVG